MHAHAHDTSYENVPMNIAESSVGFVSSLYVLHLMHALTRAFLFSVDLIEKEKIQRGGGRMKLGR
jgi:hypothetical protein